MFLDYVISEHPRVLIQQKLAAHKCSKKKNSHLKAYQNNSAISKSKITVNF